MKQILSIIPCAGHPTNSIHASYNKLPDCMIPINSKPVIGHILDDLIQKNIHDVIIGLNRDDVYTEKYISIRYHRKMNIHYVYIEDNKLGLLGTITKCINSTDCRRYSSIYINLGDTIYKGEVNLECSFFTIKEEYEDSRLRCFVEHNDGIIKCINKPEKYEGSGKILTGIYFFREIDSFLNIISDRLNIELHDVIERYSEIEKFELIQSEKWYDIGNINNYYAAKIDFLKIRGFNSIVFNENYGTITKSSKNNEKISQEINWYINMPFELKIFTPRLINYTFGERSTYEIEYYGYQSLGDLYLYGYLHINVWKSIVDKMFSTLDLFKKHISYQPKSFFYDMYFEKTRSRITEMKKNEYFDKLWKLDKLMINGIPYDNIKKYMELLPGRVDQIYNEKDICFIHGDFCLSNILYDVGNKILKMIDPRGYFGEKGIYGDIKYDIAKMKHSFEGKYDFIVSDLFNIEEKKPDEFNFYLYTEEIHEKIAQYFVDKLEEKGYNKNVISIIEGILFLSMIPLHGDNFDRQKAMYLTSVKIFNNITIQ